MQRHYSENVPEDEDVDGRNESPATDHVNVRAFNLFIHPLHEGDGGAARVLTAFEIHDPWNAR
jgi:hypothetical protein